MNLPAFKVHALRSLAQMGGQPMPDSALRDSLRLAFRHQRITETAINQALLSLDAEGCLLSTEEAVTKELHWSLTTKGDAAAARFA